ncbi:uncharacterized protein LOC106946757 [Poecilia latipinna]|uniref:uncharacterized protein LOC106940418 n=1 Tax=Poecilia latipinna TaxID=48699 RepID=UPI00072E5E66|nr:PREDICTED: uncharacterized protein LOC106940418 [Poecilia latipinna]XP_014886857.1 PREDICTED: uncharacterized protein LOC106946757 [Poecilia latipinna]
MSRIKCCMQQSEMFFSVTHGAANFDLKNIARFRVFHGKRKHVISKEGGNRLALPPHAELSSTTRLVLFQHMHVSIFDLNSKIPLEECNTCCNKLFHCPICPNFDPTVKERIEKHMNHHISHGLPYKDKILLRCSLHCRPQGHFHCPICSRTVMRRLDMKRHLLLCEGFMEKDPSPEPCLPPTSLPNDHLIKLLSSPSVKSLLQVIPPSKKPLLQGAPSSVEPLLPDAAPTVKPFLPDTAPGPVSDPQSSTSSNEHSYSQASGPDVTTAYGNAVKCPHCNNNIYLLMFNKPPTFNISN